MVHKTIFSHADLQALPLPGRSDEEVCVELVSVESVSIARESYTLLPLLVDQRSCLCPQLDFLSLVACLSLELHKVEHDLLPPLQIQEAKLDRASLEALLFLKNSAITLLRLAKRIKAIEQGLGLLEEGLEEGLQEHVFSCRVKGVGISLVDSADHVLGGTFNIVWLKARVPFLLKLVNDLLSDSE
ncbi:unnamed protein product [Urochloa decumbens]|uniref:Uncharacterized protein n=1 Tax=Urochloa decumbens TaxID=240449 RepID=A0ABC8Y5K7_9POAL